MDYRNSFIFKNQTYEKIEKWLYWTSHLQFFVCLFFFSFPCSFSWGNFNGKSSNTAVNFVMAMLWIPRHTVFSLKQELPPQCCMHPCFSYFEVYINSCSECLDCLGTGPSSLNPLQDNHCYVAILSPTWYFLVPSTSDFFFFSPLRRTAAVGNLCVQATGRRSFQSVSPSSWSVLTKQEPGKKRKSDTGMPDGHIRL